MSSPRPGSSAAGSTRSPTCPARCRSPRPGAEKALQEIWNAESKTEARKAVRAFAKSYGAKFPRAAAEGTGRGEELPAFCDYPAGHRARLRTTNPIEPALATVRHRTKVTKGPGPGAAGIAMAFKLVEAAQRRWRSVNAPHLVALVRAGAESGDGKLAGRSETDNQRQTAVEDEIPAAA